MGTLKEQLPFPYDQDLSQVVRRLDRRTPDARKRLANDPVTAAYLAAAMRLIERHLGPGVSRTSADPEDANSFERPLLSFLSQRVVAAEVGRNPDPFPRRGNVSTMRSNWKSQSDFVADVLSFGLWSQYHQAQWRSSDVMDAAGQLIAGPGFSEAVHFLAYRNTMIFAARPRFRLELIAAAVAEGDPVVHEALVELYQAAVAPWKQILCDLLRARGLRLRPGITPEIFADLIAAAAKGTAVHGLENPRVLGLDHDRERSLLGTAVHALILGCMEPTGLDGTSLEQAVAELVYGPGEGGRGVQAASASGGGAR